MGRLDREPDCPDCARLYYLGLNYPGPKRCGTCDSSCSSDSCYNCNRNSMEGNSKKGRKHLLSKKAACNARHAAPITLLSVTKLGEDFEGGGGSEYPYLREMKERLLITKEDPVMDISHSDQDNQLLEVHQTPVSTVVRLNADGYGSHTSPTHRVESLYTGTLESRRTHAHEFFPKNAKTSTFITLSLLYATLLVVVCLGFVLSEVLTHNVPLYYYEAFFTYLYGLSIFFLLYVFCYLLTDSSREIKPPNNQVYMVRLSSLPFYPRASLTLGLLCRSWLL